ncbi:ECF-type sigma factor [Aquisphaera giovannonii]|uniref:ECF-type sigma factor n=1 Tax=Aquisphaera giovannonii TaxID=406548 RepID=UPI001FE90AAF|nr:ECF-type sigma factor [Aquisphaera giovannonii]
MSASSSEPESGGSHAANAPSTPGPGVEQAAGRLLAMVYDELRVLAARKLAKEKAGQTLQATALVHEAFLRLVRGGDAASWQGRGHFYAAAAEAMRRILIENARRKGAEKHGGGRTRIELDFALDAADRAIGHSPEELLDLDEALRALAVEDPDAARIVELRIFAGLSVEGAAEVMGISRAGAYEQWTYGRAWLTARLRDGDPSGPRGRNPRDFVDIPEPDFA